MHIPAARLLRLSLLALSGAFVVVTQALAATNTPTPRLSPSPSPSVRLSPTALPSATPTLVISPPPASSPSVSPSILPTSTVLVTQRNDLTGKVTYAKSDFGLEKVDIYDVTNDTNPVKLGTTDENGNYTVRNIPVGDRYLSFRRNLFEESKEQIEMVAAPTKNTLDVEMSLLAPNKVGGVIYLKNLGEPDEGTVAVKVQKKLSATKWETVGMVAPDDFRGTDTASNTDYLFQSPLLRKGDYRVLVVKADNSILGSAMVTFTEDAGQSVRKDITIQPGVPNKKYSISFSAFRYAEDAHLIPLSATVTVKQVGTNNTWTRPVPTKLTGLSAGSYTYSYTHTAGGKSVTEDEVTIAVAGEKLDHYVKFDYLPEEETTTVITGSVSGGCERHPMGGIQEFWFCGESALALYKDASYNSLLSTMASRLTALRAKYGYSDLPQVVYIASVPVMQGLFWGGTEDPPPCPPRLGVTSDGNSPNDRILFTTSLIKKLKDQPDALNAIMTHEFGHAVDWRFSECEEFVSENSLKFNDLRSLGATLYNKTFWGALKDGNYIPAMPQAGHAHESNAETWASAFNLKESYPQKKYSNAGGTITAELKRILDALVDFPLKENPS